jgi:hypothetical protein
MYVKRWIWMLLLAAILCGCKAEETLETVSDEWIVSAMAQPREISVRLPENTVLPVMEQDGRRMYMGQDYEIMLETMAAGDLRATIRSLSGYEQEQLTVLETHQGDCSRYEFVWTTAGEQGDRLGRAVILDDGTYHYCMSVLREPGETLIVWRDVFQSFSLLSY